MRPIKFRAWDKTKKEMDYSDSFIRPHAGFSENEGNKLSMFFAWWQFDISRTLMQFTGLKDWHDKEIYEGDIVAFTRTDDIPEAFDSVEVIENMHEIYQHCWDKGVDYSDIKVIGNIYENPELLK